MSRKILFVILFISFAVVSRPIYSSDGSNNCFNNSISQYQLQKLKSELNADSSDNTKLWWESSSKIKQVSLPISELDENLVAHLNMPTSLFRKLGITGKLSQWGRTLTDASTLSRKSMQDDRTIYHPVLNTIIDNTSFPEGTLTLDARGVVGKDRVEYLGTDLETQLWKEFIEPLFADIQKQINKQYPGRFKLKNVSLKRMEHGENNNWHRDSADANNIWRIAIPFPIETQAPTVYRPSGGKFSDVEIQGNLGTIPFFKGKNIRHRADRRGIAGDSNGFRMLILATLIEL